MASAVSDWLHSIRRRPVRRWDATKIGWGRDEALADKRVAAMWGWPHTRRLTDAIFFGLTASSRPHNNPVYVYAIVGSTAAARPTFDEDFNGDLPVDVVKLRLRFDGHIALDMDSLMLFDRDDDILEWALRTHQLSGEAADEWVDTTNDDVTVVPRWVPLTMEPQSRNGVRNIEWFTNMYEPCYVFVNIVP